MLGHGDDGRNALFLTGIHHYPNHSLGFRVGELVILSGNAEQGHAVAAIIRHKADFPFQTFIIHFTGSGKGRGNNRTNTFQFHG